MKIEIRMIYEPSHCREYYYILPAGYDMESKSFVQLYNDCLYFGYNRSRVEKKFSDMLKGGQYE